MSTLFRSLRLGNHASPKENQQLIVARFDKEGNELVRNDLETLFSQSRIPMVATNPSRSSPTHNSPCDSASCSGSSTPQRTSSPYPTTGQPSLNIPSTTIFRNGPLFTPPRALSPQAPAFQMSPSAPIKVPVKYEQNHFLQNNSDSISCEGSPSDGNILQPDRSDTPHSVHSTTSNESSDSGYCGYVESFPCKKISFSPLVLISLLILFAIDYYKLNRLYKALAIQKLSHPMGKVAHNSPATHHHRRLPMPPHYQAQQQQHHHHQQQQPANNHHHNNTIPSSTMLSSSPPTPTPMNIDQFTPFYAQQSSFLPMPTTVPDSRKSKY